jgi:hypothetical protein
MIADQMRVALLGFGNLVRGPRADSVYRLASLFEGLGTTKVASIVKTIEHNWKAENRVRRHPSELRETVAGIEQALVECKAGTQAKAFGSLLQLFSGQGNQPDDAFVAEAIAARAKRTRPRAATRAAFTAEQARRFADELASATDDRTRFDTLLDELKAQLGVAELKKIAKLYTGYETTKTKKDDIVKAIRHWHREDEMNRDRRAAQAKVPV